MASRVNVGITGDNSGLQTAINQSRNTLKDFVTDFSRKASELNAMSGKVGDAQRKLVLSGNLDSQAKAVGNTLGKLNSQINVANGLYQMNGDRISLVQAKTQAYTAALTDLLSRGLKPDSDSAKALTDQIRRLNAELYVLEGPKRAAELARKLAEEQRKAGEAAARMAEEKRKADEKAAESARRLAEEEKKAAEKAAEAQRKAAQKMIDDRRKAKDEIISMTKSTGQALTLGVTAPLAAMTAMSLRAYGELDALRKGLAVVEGSQGKAMARQRELKQIYALPGLGINEALRGDVLLRQAGGYSSGESFDIMKQFGNAIALGGGGKEQFGLVLMQLTQMSTKTKVLAEDLKPLINQAPVAAGAIRKLFGTVDSEQISKQLQAAGKGPREFISMLTEELAKADRVGSGFKNGIENWTDSLTVAGDTVGRVLDRNNILTNTLSKAGEGVEALAKWFEGLSDAQQTAVIATLATAAAMGPAIYLTGSLAGSVVNLANAKKALITLLGAQRVAMIANLGPYALLAAAIIAVGAATYSLYKTYNPTIESAAKLADVSKEVASSTFAEIDSIKKLISVAGDDKKSKEERGKALDTLKNKYPDYFGKMDTENTKTGELKTAYDKLTSSILASARARAAQERIYDNERKILDLRTEAAEKYSKAVSDKNTDKFLSSNPQVLTTGGAMGRYQRAASGSNQVVELQGLNKQIVALETANKILLDIAGVKDDLSKNTTPIIPTIVDTKSSAKGRSDITEAINLLDELKNVENQTSEDRRKLNAIEKEGHEQVRKIFAMKISDGMKYQLFLESIQVTERKLFDARRETALKPIFNKPKLTPSNASVFDYLGNKGNQDVTIRMKLLWSEDKRALKDGKDAAKAGRRVDRFAEIDQIIAAANGIDLSKPLNAKERQLMDFLTNMNGILQQGAADAFSGMGEIVGGLIAGTAGINQLPQMMIGVIGGMFQQMGRAYISFGLTSTKVMPLLTNPYTAGFGAIAAGIAMTALGTGLKAATQKRQKFATGGIAYGRVFGVNAEAGEYSNARNNPEVIAPLKDLNYILEPFWVKSLQAGMGVRNYAPAKANNPINVIVKQDRRGNFYAVTEEGNRIDEIKGRP